VSIREITDEQFSEGTTIDGSRLSRALEDMSDRFSSVPKGDILQRHMQTQIVCGWSPPTGQTHLGGKTNEIQYPWLLTTNSAASDSPYSSTTKRFKSLGDPTDGTSSQYAMTLPIQLATPSIIEAVNIILLTDTRYYNWSIADFGLNNMGIQVLMTIDNPYVSEDPNMCSVSVYKDCPTYYSYDITGSAADTGIKPLNNDMDPYMNPILTPANIGHPIRGAYMKLEDLNIPLPANARLRFSLVCVNDSSESYSMWSAFSPSITVTLLEPLVSE
jgi:hypothetical protein